MSYEQIVALILSISIELGVPPYFSLAIALTENSTLNPNAVSNVNANGSVDRGIMQLSSSWYNGNWECPETNIRVGIEHIKWLSSLESVNTWWAVAICYNAGYGRLNNPPQMSIEYANRVMVRWLELENKTYINPVIMRCR